MLQCIEYYLETISTSCLHVRALCPALLQRLQRLKGWPPLLARALFFAFFLLLRALNSFRVVKRTPSLTVRVPSCCNRFFLSDLRRVAALLAA